MIIETWVAACIVIAVFVMAGISIIGWIEEGKRGERKDKKIERLIVENERLHRVINQMNGIHNIEVATAFHNKEV